MTSEILQGIVGVVLSLLFGYFPPIANWFYAFDDNKKKLIMLGFIAVISAALFAMSCSGLAEPFGLPVWECSQQGVVDFIKIFFTIAIANQTAARIAPQTEVRRESPEVEGEG